MGKKMRRKWLLYFCSALLAFLPLLSNTAAALRVSEDITIAKKEAARGEVVQVPVTMNSNGEVRGLQFDFEFDRTMASITDDDIIAGVDLPSGFTVYQNSNLKTGGKTVVRVMIVSTSKFITEGTKEIAILKFTMKDQGPVVTPITLSNVVISDANAKDITSQFAQGNGELKLYDRTVPTITLTPNPSAPTNQNVTIEVVADGTGSNITVLKWAAGNQSEDYFTDSGTNLDLSNPNFPVSANGTYTVYAEDELGNKAIQTIDITNIDTDAPLVSVTEGSTYGPLSAGVTWTDGNSATATLNGNSYTSGSPITASGTYTIVVTDAAGNEKTVTFTVDATAPVVTLNPNKPKTNTDVTLDFDPDDVKDIVVKRNGEEVPYTSPMTEEGSYEVTLKDEYGNTTVITFIIDKSQADVTLTPNPSLPANGDVTVSVTATDKGNPATGIDKMMWGPGELTESDFPSQGTTIENGQFTVQESGYYTVWVQDQAGNITIEKIYITIDRNAPTIETNLTPNGPTNGNVAVQVTVTDDQSASDKITVKWAAGQQTADEIAANGTTIPNGGQFTVQDGGKYTIWAKDEAGNETIKVIEVTNIDRSAPTIQDPVFTPNGLTNGDVTVQVTVTDDQSASSGILVKWLAGQQTKESVAANGTTMVNGGEFTVQEDGFYTIWAKDEAGNETVKVIQVTNIDKTAPIIGEPVLIPAGPTNGTVAVQVPVTDNKSTTNALTLKWAPGEQTADFVGSNGTDMVSNQFTVSANGKYTIWAKDEAGNVSTRIVDVTNIDILAPTLGYTTSTTDPTNGDVTVSITADGTGSAIAGVKYAEGAQNLQYFRDGKGVDITLDKKFIAAQNGSYTVYAIDAAGNDALLEGGSITIGNIDKVKPVFVDIIQKPVSPIDGGLPIKVIFDGTGSDIVVKKWIKGTQDELFFSGGSGNDFNAEDTFIAPSNGSYTVYTKDKAGNENVKTIYIIFMGDVTGSNGDGTPNGIPDGKITIVDYVLTANQIIGKESLSDIQVFVADMNHDGKINVLDWVLIVNEILHPAE